jgi:aspartate/methionine/tyrosine aminotransferase
MIKPATRIEGMGTSIFSTMSKLSEEYKAVNLGQGFPDFDGPEWIKEEAFKAMKEGKNQYGPSNGIYKLRSAISLIDKKYYDLNWNPDDEITVTAGATEALYCSINAFIQSGDEVVIFEPFYDSYTADVALAGAKCRFVTLYKPDFNFKIDELENAINKNTKMIIINSPHNPTGKVFTKDELDIISSFAIKHNLIVVSDEAYEFMTYDNRTHIPIATLPGMRNHTITISSTGKTFGMTGWKVGYAKACKELTNSIQKIHQWVTFTINTPNQHAIAFGFNNFDDYLLEFRKSYQTKRNLLFNGLLDTQFKPLNSFGTYFLMVNLPKNILQNDVEFAIKLVKEYKIATIPPSLFYSKSDEGSTMLRLCFAKREDTLLKGIDILKAYK